MKDFTQLTPQLSDIQITGWMTLKGRGAFYLFLLRTMRQHCPFMCMCAATLEKHGALKGDIKNVSNVIKH